MCLLAHRHPPLISRFSRVSSTWGSYHLVLEQDMGDERVEMLANEVANRASLASSQQQTLKELQEMMAVLHARLDHIAGNRNGNHGESSHRRNEVESSHRRTNHGSTGSGSTLIPKVTKLDFPRFNGRDGPTS